MKTSLIVAIAVAIGLGVSTVPSLLSLTHAEGLNLEGKDALKVPGKSLTETTGKLKTDATQTKDDVRKLDIQKSQQGVGQVQEDVKVVKESAKGAMTNPLGK